MTAPAYSDVDCHRGRHPDSGWYCVAHGQSWPCHNLRAGDCEALAARTVFPSLRESCPTCHPAAT